MVRRQLDERQWAKVEAVLAAERRAGRPPKDNRNFVEAVLWWRRTGVPWRDLPGEFGPWKTVFTPSGITKRVTPSGITKRVTPSGITKRVNRFDRWPSAGRWSRLFHALQTDRDDEWHSIDSTINRAHQHAAGGKGGPRSRA